MSKKKVKTNSIRIRQKSHTRVAYRSRIVCVEGALAEGGDEYGDVEV
ncbi:MAG: hypothetical protein HYY41_01470 [Chloroflexi bacterium]|nr:hypothetical protein [Chloroflexota bacterium]